MNKEIAYNVMKPLVIIESTTLNERNGTRQIKEKNRFDSFVDTLRGDTCNK